MQQSSPDLAEKQNPQPERRHQGPTEALEEGRKRIPLTQGLFAIVDEKDFDWLSKFKWHAARLGRRKTPYAKRVDYSLGRNNRKQIFMHSSIIGGSTVVDHKNGNTLDCTRGNLRPCSRQQNSFNKTVTTKNNGRPTKFKGVCWHKRSNKWQASICLNRKKIHIGYFDSEADAARAYDRKAIELFGEFSCLNTHCVDLKAARSPLDQL